MSIFEWLIVVHLVADWVLQTEYQALNKAEGKFFNRALWAHCVNYTACFIPVIFWGNLPVWWLLWILSTHLFLDRRWPIIWIRLHVHHDSPENIAKSFWLTIAVDQVAHILVLAVVAAAR